MRRSPQPFPFRTLLTVAYRVCMGEKRRCLKFKIVRSKAKHKGRPHFVARCVEFQDGKGKPACPSQGLVTFGRSQSHIRSGTYSCRGVKTRHSASSNATLSKPKPRSKSR